MNTSNLYKVELYRFFQSLKLFVLFGVASVIVMVLMSADTSVFETDVSYGNEIQTIFKMMGMFFALLVRLAFLYMLGMNLNVKRYIMKL